MALAHGGGGEVIGRLQTAGGEESQQRLDHQQRLARGIARLRVCANEVVGSQLGGHGPAEATAPGEAAGPRHFGVGRPF